MTIAEVLAILPEVKHVHKVRLRPVFLCWTEVELSFQPKWLCF